MTEPKSITNARLACPRYLSCYVVSNHSKKLIPMLSWVYRPLVLGAMTEAKGVTEPSLLHAWWVQTVVMVCCFMFCYFVHPKSTKRQIPMLSWVWKPSGPGCTDPSSPITKSMLCPCEAVFSTDMSIPSNKLIRMLSWVYRPLVLGAMAPGVCVL